MNGSGGKKHHSSMNCFYLKRQLWRDSTMNRNGLPRKAVRNGSLTRMKIIETASAEFVEKGYAGARVDEIVKKAGDCKEGNRCLTGNRGLLCPVERLIGKSGGELAFVRCVQGKQCPFITPFGTSGHHVCSCPVRLEIYKRYRK